jgi:hypothetical protein
VQLFEVARDLRDRLVRLARNVRASGLNSIAPPGSDSTVAPATPDHRVDASSESIAPSTALSDQRNSFSTGAANKTNSRVASAPNASIISSGSTPLPRLFDIAFHSSVPSTRFVTMPCVNNRFTGSSKVNQSDVAHELGPEARVDQMHHCM